MTVNSMTIHDTKHPKILNTIEVLLHNETVLVYFSHLRDVASPCFIREMLDYLDLISSLAVITMDFFARFTSCWKTTA